MANQVIGTDFNKIKHNVQKAKNVIENMFYDSRKLNENDYKYWSKFQINRKGLSVLLKIACNTNDKEEPINPLHCILTECLSRLSVIFLILSECS